MLRKDKQAELETLCSELEENSMRDNSRSVFQTVKKLTRIFQSRFVAIKDVHGIKQTEPEKVCQQWKEYCEGLFDDKEENVKTYVQEREHLL